MTPKEKAEYLIKQYDFVYIPNYTFIHDVKNCALIAVDEILKTDPMIEWGESDAGIEYKSNDDYWEEVKEEILKL